MKQFTKDPQAVLDYVWDWTDWLENDTITDADVTVPAGITLVAEPVELDGKVTAFISGGTLGESYTVVCTIVTAGGRTDERSAIFNIKNR